jgi:4'-phosphopantetheinyl transferase
MSSTSCPQITITRWLLDTRGLWPGDKITDTSASSYLSLISEPERQVILRKYHIADAKMSLASALLKRAYINQCTGLAWDKISFGRNGHPVHGKPAWKPPDWSTPGHPWPRVDFNISHQAGLVTLVGAHTSGRSKPTSAALRDGETRAREEGRECEEEVLVGCDIVAPNERQDLERIRSSNLDEWTSGFAEVFSHEELWDITYTLPSHSLALLNGESVSSTQLGRADRLIVCDQAVTVVMDDGRVESFMSDLIIDTKLRRFYTFFALKEAYIKLVGEGLLATWIKRCEFKNVRAPSQGVVARCSTHGVWGGKVHGGRTISSIVQGTDTNGHHDAQNDEEQLEIWLDGQEIVNVRTEVQAFEEDFIIATMVRPNTILGPNEEFPPWHNIDLEQDILRGANPPDGVG